MEHQVFGGIAALVSAFFWALGAILWRKIGEKISPFSMNLSKGIIGILYLTAVLLVIGIQPVNMRAFLFLGASGLLGITLGDTFYFMSLMHLGPRLAALMGSLAPVFIAFSAVIFLGERPSFLVWVGIFLTVGGVAWVLWEPMPQKEIIKNKSLGIKYGLLSIISMSAGVIFAKIGIISVSAIQATFLRIFWGVIGLSLWGCLNRQLKNWLTPFKNLRLLKTVSFVVFIGVFGGFWLFLLALKYIDASVAITLNSTAPLFILPMVAIILKEKIPIRAILGAVIAVGGVALIFMGR